MGRRAHKPLNVVGPHAFAFLSAWRERSGLTQAHVAAQLGVSDVTVHRWEQGKAPVTTQCWMTLANIYGAEPGSMFFAPDDEALAESIRHAAQIIIAMDDEARTRWLEVGHYMSRTEKLHNK